MTDQRSTRLADGEDDDLEVANPEDYEVVRNEDGDLLPVLQRIPGTDDAIEVKPMAPGAFQEWLPVLEGQDEDSERQAQVMRQFIEAPEAFATADADYVKNDLRGGVLGGILKAIRNAAGYEVFRAAREEDLEDGAKMLNEMGADAVEDLMAATQPGAENNGEL